MKKVEYYVYSIKYERLNNEGKKERIGEHFFLREDERNYIYENGTSQIYLNVFPAKMRGLFHAWNIPEKCIKSKHTYLCKEPSEEQKQAEKGLTAEDYIVEEITSL